MKPAYGYTIVFMRNSIHDYFAFLPSAGDPQPQQMYSIYEKQIKDLLSCVQGVKISSKLLQRVYEDK